MQPRCLAVHACSRLFAVLLVAIPLAYFARILEEAEQAMVAKMSHNELLEYLREGQSQSFLGQYVQLVVMTLVYVAAVEAVAFGFRRTVALFQTSKFA